jgi:hypothetical protein
VKSFLDFFGLWTAINMTAWFTLWWTYDKNVTVEDELRLLIQTSIGATALTLAVWGITRASRAGSSVPEKYAKKAESAFDAAVQVEEKRDES